MPGDADLVAAQATIAQQAGRIRDLEQRIEGLLLEAKALHQARENDAARIASMQRRIRQLLREIYGPRNEGHKADPAVVADLLRNPAPLEPDDPTQTGEPAGTVLPPPEDAHPNGSDAASTASDDAQPGDGAEDGDAVLPWDIRNRAQWRDVVG